MKISLLSLFSASISALPSPHTQQNTIPPFFLLAGDSTTATQSSGGGGWGDGFINTTLHSGAKGLNYGHDGATTVSFRAGGDWATVLSKVKEYKTDYRAYVTIQFGHNDQKPANNISLTEYTKNLEQFATDVKNAGGTPILVTPLSRRNYDNTTGTPTVIQDLADQRAATIAAANNTDTAYIDLNKASTDYLNAIGPVDAYTYNLTPDDHTHLNVAGSQVFGGLVASLIDQDFPELKNDDYVVVNPALLTALAAGKYYWP
ncbi:SGNH hydrolase [Aspergillus sclerotioniger CBS 115572]|uniref:SGNH hydrolase n=1 Tax=Aspergillus sclerotioniger CBS 115572 TaxID=1450535 RepID=A0A317V3F4_9EURO|nr:SGNH hydrolase [Aspergillus sclerotioniger CBS 115572]PWY67588.1 SGNH hydrolase [Aspergillus sclerotioniger CBS 115572]